MQAIEKLHTEKAIQHRKLELYVSLPGGEDDMSYDEARERRKRMRQEKQRIEADGKIKDRYACED